MGDIDEISHKIGSLETKVDHLHDDIKNFMERFDKHDERLGEIEKFKNYALGVIAIVSIVFTMAIEFVKERVLKGA